MPVKKNITKNKKISVATMQDDLAKTMSTKNNHKNISDSRSEDLEMQRKLTEVYTDSDGEIPDLTRLENIQRPLWKTIIYVLIVLFSILLFVAILGFWIFSKWDMNGFANENVILKIDTPITLVSGQDSTYTITITNNEKVNLYNLELELFYPDNFEYIDSAPLASGDRNNKWDFSVLKIGETKRIELQGVVVAPLKSVQTFKGKLNFKPANLNSDFKQEAIVDIAVSASMIMLDIDGPKKSLANQEVEYVIKYENLSEKDITDLQIVATYAEGFVFGSSEPEQDNKINNTWDIKSLKSGEGGEIKILGDYSAAGNSGNRDFIARVQIKKDGDYYPQSEDTVITEVIKDQLSMQLIVNGSGEDQPISFDDLLVYSLNYKNTGEEVLENIQITANLNSEILDWDSLVDQNNGVIGKNSITWNGRHIPKLLKLGANEEGEIVFQIRVKDAGLVANDNIGKFSVETFAEAKSQQTGELSGESTITTKTIVNSVNSDLSMVAEARYYSEDDIALGLGPIEPKAGETSTYNIKFELSNNLNNVENVRMTAKLPSNVFWSNRENHDSGDLSYNAATNEVVWNISRLEKSASPTVAFFNVDITPSNDNIGRILILLSDIKLSAKDSDTGAVINKEHKAITTAFDDPIVGKVNGIVQ